MFRVAKDLGKTVYQLSQEMSYRELMEWAVYYERVEANRVDKRDVYLARIAYMLCGDEKAKLKDFILCFDKEKKESELIKVDGKIMAQIFKAALGVKEDKTDG